MITASAAFDAAIKQASRTFRAQFFDNGTLIDADIRRLVIYKGSCGNSDLRPGAVYSSYVEAVIDHCSTALEGKELELRIGVMTGGTLVSPVFEYIRIGFYTAGKPATSTRSTTFTAYGAIQAKLGEKLSFTSADGLPSVEDVIEKIQEISGVQIETDTGMDTSVHLNAAFLAKCLLTNSGLTCREALEAVAFAEGGFATETPDGGIRISKYGTEMTVSFSAAETCAETPEFHDIDTCITGLQVSVSEDAIYSSGYPVNLETDNMYMTEESFENCASNLIGLEYRGGKVALTLGDPRLEPWDTLEVTDTDNEQFLVPCMNLVFTFDGGLQTLCEAPSIETPGALEKAIAETRLTAGAAQETAKEAVEILRIQQADIDRLKARYIETLLIHSPDYDAVEIPYVYPADDLYPADDVYPSDGTLVKSGFALDLANGLILGAFYSRQLASLEERVARLEQRNSLSMMMSPMSTNTEENDELR